MKTIIDWIRETQQQGATAFRLSPGQVPACRIGKEWQACGNSAWVDSEIRSQVQAYLDAGQKKSLESEGFAAGTLKGGSTPIQFQVVEQSEGWVAGFAWQQEARRTLDEWNLPTLFLEKAQRQSGLFLISGPHRSGRSTLLRQLANRLASQGQTLFFVSENPEFSSHTGVMDITTSAFLKTSDKAILTSLYFIDSDQPQVQAQAVRLAATGGRVFLTATASSIPNAMSQVVLHAVTYLTEQGAPSATAERLVWGNLADCLVAALGVRLLAGLESSLQPAFELLAASDEVQMRLREGSVFGLVEIMSKGGDKSGMRTLNQAILQLLMKRRIELRVGFEESPNALELDQLLKKIGV